MPRPTQLIGMIGIGQLGLPIATNLLRAGYRVVGYRRTDPEDFVKNGGEALGSPGEVAAVADVLLLCLPSINAQNEVLNGDSGVLAALRSGSIVIEMGSYEREFKVHQSEQIERHGGRMLEAEVSGSPPMVAARRAALYLGGAEELLTSCKFILTAITEHHFHLGPVGSAVAMKLIANALVAVHTLAAAEAMNLGVKAGFSAQKVAEVLALGAGNSAMLSIRAPLMAKRAFTPAMGSFYTLEKYLLMGQAMAQSLNSSTPLLSAAAPYFMKAIANGYGDQDIAAVIRTLEQDA